MKLFIGEDCYELQGADGTLDEELAFAALVNGVYLTRYNRLSMWPTKYPLIHKKKPPFPGDEA